MKQDFAGVFPQTCVIGKLFRGSREDMACGDNRVGDPTGDNVG
jgi:hypothetical protein